MERASETERLTWLFRLYDSGHAGQTTEKELLQALNERTRNNSIKLRSTLEDAKVLLEEKLPENKAINLDQFLQLCRSNQQFRKLFVDWATPDLIIPSVSKTSKELALENVSKELNMIIPMSKLEFVRGLYKLKQLQKSMKDKAPTTKLVEKVK